MSLRTLRTLRTLRKRRVTRSAWCPHAGCGLLRAVRCYDQWASAGIGIHHAGLEPHVRRTIENAFKSGKLLLLCATSTLALGVNLPAYMVIVKNTQKYDKGRTIEYHEHQVLQMIGRAGRPQFETEGKAVIMTRTAKRQDYLDLAGGTQLVESHLASAMVGHVNAEIALGTITDIPTVLSWLKFSYLWVRIRKSPQHYGIAATDSTSAQRLEDRLQEMALEDIQKLADLKAITLSEDMLLKPTHAGKQMAKWSIAYETFRTLYEGKCGESGISFFFAVFFCCGQFSRSSQLYTTPHAAV